MNKPKYLWKRNWGTIKDVNPIKFDTRTTIKGHSDEEMDNTTCEDLVSDSRANYENSQCADQTGEISYEFGVR